MPEILMVLMVFAFIFIGFLGVLLPLLPGVPIAWLGLFLYAFYGGFEKISLKAIVVFFILTIATIVLDLLLPVLGAKAFKASRYGLIGATAGLLLGVSVGPVGIIVGPIIGALLAELIAGRNLDEATRASGGTVLGLILSTGLKLLLLLAMAVFFVLSMF